MRLIREFYDSFFFTEFVRLADLVLSIWMKETALPINAEKRGERAGARIAGHGARQAKRKAPPSLIPNRKEATTWALDYDPGMVF